MATARHCINHSKLFYRTRMRDKSVGCHCFSVCDEIRIQRISHGMIKVSILIPIHFSINLNCNQLSLLLDYGVSSDAISNRLNYLSDCISRISCTALLLMRFQRSWCSISIHFIKKLNILVNRMKKLQLQQKLNPEKRS